MEREKEMMLILLCSVLVSRTPDSRPYRTCDILVGAFGDGIPMLPQQPRARIGEMDRENAASYAVERGATESQDVRRYEQGYRAL